METDADSLLLFNTSSSFFGPATLDVVVSLVSSFFCYFSSLLTSLRTLSAFSRILDSDSVALDSFVSFSTFLISFGSSTGLVSFSSF